MASGKDTQRPELDLPLAFVREGDTVVVHSMDRLARSLDDLRRLVQKLTKRDVRIEFAKESLTFTGEDSPTNEWGAAAPGSARASSGRYVRCNRPSVLHFSFSTLLTNPRNRNAENRLKTYCAQLQLFP